ncbi:MAG TPA: hypothetical protein VHE37_09505 [Nevskiaceae bacterium]|nr:hypothetical protein [Nevskiaceae bacterium]
MSRIQQALHNDYQAISLLRDELKLQAHLFRADARQRWQELEVSFDTLKEHVQRAKTAAAVARPEVETASRLLADTLKAGYADIRNALKREVA